LTDSDLPVAGIVGGGTTTECAVIDAAGAVIATARHGPSNPNFVPLEEARANVTAALAEALTGIERCRAAGHALFEPVAPDGGEATEQVLAPLLRRTATIRRYTEHEAALAACGIYETDGVAVIAGTGSSAVAVRNGQRRVAGGWGALLGDQGSAYDIGLWAVRAAIRSSERTGPSIPLLEERVTTHFGVERFWDLVPRFYTDGVTRVEIADLCRVIAPDAAGEPAIAARFACAGKDLASLAVAAASDLYGPADSPVVAMSGGVWAAGDVIATPFEAAVRGTYPEARLMPEQDRPAVGIARRVMKELTA
jgi:N-acetylglucosamine kinase-like BadF-type ATPase